MGLLNLNKQDNNIAISQLEKEVNGNLTSDNLVSGVIDNLLPSQTGNSGKYLTTNGSASSWATVGAGESSSWISANELKYGSVSTAMYSGVTYLEFPDTGNNEAGGTTRVPTGKTGISSIKIYYKNESINKNVNFSSRVYIFNAGAAETANADTTATTRAYATTATVNNIEAIILNADVIDGLSAFSAGQIFSIEIKRNASEVSDDYAAVLKVLGVLITWS